MADAACIVLLPLAVDPAQAGGRALGALAVLAAGAVVFVLLRTVERNGWRRKVHVVSEERGLALELRVSLTVLFALCALAQLGGVSVMLAGFVAGLAVAAVGPPRSLAPSRAPSHLPARGTPHTVSTSSMDAPEQRKPLTCTDEKRRASTTSKLRLA
ncbi:MAG: hypothetical protein Q4G43_00465 [Mobilicoccus sp.]|nr:hypothetical protein [Mobilicoccus sp.]